MLADGSPTRRGRSCPTPGGCCGDRGDCPGFGRPAPVAGGRWADGETVVYRWGREGRTRFARLARVVRHDDEGLLLWVGEGGRSSSRPSPTAAASGRRRSRSGSPRRARAGRALARPRCAHARAARADGVVGVVVLHDRPGRRPGLRRLVRQPRGAARAADDRARHPARRQRRPRARRRGSRPTAPRAGRTRTSSRRSPRSAPAGPPGRRRGSAPTVSSSWRWPVPASHRSTAAGRTSPPTRRGRVPRFPADWDVPHVAGP